MRRSDQNGTIPDGWQMVRLGDVAEVVGGTTPSRAQGEYWGGEIPWVVPSELTELSGRYLTSTRESITPIGMQVAGLRVIPAGSVLLTSRATIGAVAINGSPVTTNQGFQNLVPKNGTEGLWLYYWIVSMRHELQKRGSGSTFKEVSRDSVRSLPLLLPPIAEQRRVATVLDAIDDAIERMDDVIAATERLRHALLHDLLAHGIPGWHSEWRDVPSLGTIPVGWEVVRLSDVAEIETGGTPSRSEPSFWGGSIPWMASGEINQRRLRETAERITIGGLRNSNAKIFPRGTVMIAMNGQGTTRGKACILDIEAACNQSLAAIRSGMWCRNRFLFYLLDSAYEELRRITGDGRNGLNLKLLRAFRIPLPSLDEQEAICTILNRVDVALESVSHELHGLQSLRTSAANALLSGRVRVVATQSPRK